MELGNVKSASATYQGSRLDSSVSQKVVVEAKAPEAAPVIEKTSKGNENREEGETPALEIKESNSNRQDSVKRAVEELNRRIKHSEAVFGIHEKTNRVTIKIVDWETKEVLKEIPPEQTLDMIAKVWELAGLMVDEKR